LSAGAEGTLRAAMVAGETSGDMLAAHLMAALVKREPRLSFRGIGGPRLIAQGFESLFPMERLAVRGYFEVLRHYRGIMRIRDQLARLLLADPPRVFIGVDASDFNLGLERRLRAAGIPAVHFVSPSVWAWRGWRLRRIARSVTRILVMFPFEPAIYEKAGIPVTYVGHPLADVIPMEVDKAEARAQLKLPPGRKVIALLPGSRRSELQYMADLFVRTAQLVGHELKDAHFVCPTATRATREMFAAALDRNGARELPLTLLFGHSHDALAAADIALVASGTATLETALCKTPMVITYRQSPLTWMLMRRMLYVPHVGLPNILAGEQLVPELLQDKATPESLAAELLGLLGDLARQRAQIARFREFHLSLRQDCAARAADAVLDVLREGRA
jgi:lipid-A-disaccharide synthase